jgi:hypothetical protein
LLTEIKRRKAWAILDAATHFDDFSLEFREASPEERRKMRIAWHAAAFAVQAKAYHVLVGEGKPSIKAQDDAALEKAHSEWKRAHPNLTRNPAAKELRDLYEKARGMKFPGTAKSWATKVWKWGTQSGKW